jgi:hypothetical protein
VTSRTLSPVIRALAPAAALTLLLSACGGSDGESSSSAENEEGSAAEAAEEASDQPSITEPGLLSSTCPEQDRVFTLFSADDGTEITSLVFSEEDLEPGTSDVLGYGRTPTPESGTPSICQGDPLFPTEHLLLVSYTEEVNGNRVDVFGVVSEEGILTTLSPEQEVSDFGIPVETKYPRYDPVNERIIYVETEAGAQDGSFKAMDLYSGEISELRTCDFTSCGPAALLPESGIPVSGYLGGGSDASTAIIESPDGQTLLHADQDWGSLLLHFADLETVTADPDAGKVDSQIYDEAEFRAHLKTTGMPIFIDENSLLLSDNELSVWEFTEDTLLEHENSQGDRGLSSWDPLSADRTLVPAGTRLNTFPMLSPDGSEVLFLSKPETGEESWYRVPVDGSSEPEEAFQLPVYPDSILRWQ